MKSLKSLYKYSTYEMVGERGVKMSSVTENVTRGFGGYKKIFHLLRESKTCGCDKISYCYKGKIRGAYLKNRKEIFLFGENRVQVLEEKLELLGDEKDKIQWNFISSSNFSFVTIGYFVTATSFTLSE